MGLLDWFRKPLAFNDPAYFYEVKGGWGTAIEFEKDNAPEGKSSRDRRVRGWQSRGPKVGDVLTAAMSSGRVGVYIFTAVKYVSDPNDMFFADVTYRGYEDELAMPVRAKRSCFI